MNNYIIADNITKIYNLNDKINVKALDNVSFSVEDKGMVFIVGKSGCGKSTLMNILGGLDKPTGGTLTVNNKIIDYSTEKNLDEYRNSYIGFIFQDHHLIDSFSIRDNMKIPLIIGGGEISENKIIECLKLVGMNEFIDRFPNEISGGQRQRVSIARAMIKNPKIILADEPTGNLDSTTSKQIFELMKKISENKLVIIVTHDLDSAYLYGDRILELNDGKIINDRIKVSEFNLDKIKEKYNAEVNKSYKINKKSYIKPANREIYKQSAKSKIKMNDAFKIMLNWFKKGKFAFILSTIILSVALTAFGIFNNIRSYSGETAIKTTLYKNDPGTAIILNTVINEEKMSLNKNATFTKEKIDLVYSTFDEVFNGYMFPVQLDKFIDVNNKPFNTKINGICEISGNFDDNSLSKFYHSSLVAGRYPASNKDYIEVLISDFLADSILYFGVNLPNSVIYPNVSRDKILYKTFEYNIFKFKIVGIYKCSYSDVYKNLPQNYKASSELNYSVDYIFPILLTTENAVKNYTKRNQYFQIDSDFAKKGDKLYTNYESFAIGIDSRVQLNLVIASFSLDTRIIYSSDKTNDKIKNDDIIISFSRYLDIFNKYEFDNDGNLISSFDKISGKDLVNLELVHSISGDKRTFNVIGVYDDTNFTPDLIVVSSSTKDEFIDTTITTTNLFVTVPNDKNFIRRLADFTNLHSMTIFTAFTEKLYYFDNLFIILTDIINGATIIILGFVILLLYSVISKNIKEKEKDIGILRAMGTTSTDLVKIFFFNDIFYITISSILSCILYLWGCDVFNKTISANMRVNMSVISGDFVSILLIRYFGFCCNSV